MQLRFSDYALKQEFPVNLNSRVLQFSLYNISTKKELSFGHFIFFLKKEFCFGVSNCTVPIDENQKEGLISKRKRTIVSKSNRETCWVNSEFLCLLLALNSTVKHGCPTGRSVGDRGQAAGSMKAQGHHPIRATQETFRESSNNEAPKQHTNRASTSKQRRSRGEASRHGEPGWCGWRTRRRWWTWSRGRSCCGWSGRGGSTSPRRSPRSARSWTGSRTRRRPAPTAPAAEPSIDRSPDFRTFLLLSWSLRLRSPFPPPSREAS